MNLVPERKPAPKTAVNHTRRPTTTTDSTDPPAVLRDTMATPQPLSNMDRRHNRTAMAMATISNGNSTNRAVATAATRNGVDMAAAVTTKHQLVFGFRSKPFSLQTNVSLTMVDILSPLNTVHHSYTPNSRLDILNTFVSLF